ARIVSAGKANPAPMPSRSIGTNQSRTYWVLIGLIASRTSDTAIRTCPPSSTERAPNRMINRADAPTDRAANASALGRKASAFAQPDPAVGLEQAGGQQRGRHPDRKIDEKDPVPANGLGNQAAGEEADGRAGGGDEGEDAEGPGSFPRFREHADDHAQDDRRA